MEDQSELGKEEFLLMARAAGLDTTDTKHMEELKRYVQAVLRGMSSIDKLDLSHVEPEPIYIPE